MHCMRGRHTAIAFLAIVATACADPGPARKNAFGRVLLYNGATPGVSPSAPSAPAAPAANGVWAVTPDRAILHLQTVTFTGAAGSKTVDIGCAAVVEKANYSLQKLTDCNFVTDTGTYTSMSLDFAADEELLINDSVSGFYTTPAGVTLTPPAGGAQEFTFMVPSAVNGVWHVTFDLSPTLQLTQTGGTILSFVINGLHFLQVQVNNGQASLTGTASTQRPGIVAFLNATPVGAEYYVQQQIGTAGAYCVSQCSSAIPAGVKSFSLYYTNGSIPLMAALDYNGVASNCTNLGPSLIDNRARSYIGLDATGNVSWAMPSSTAWTSYVAEMSVQRLTTLGQTTTLYCKNRSTDPAPAGGSYASGAPAINSPANSLGTFVLVAK